jgi:hypothetical protein
VSEIVRHATELASAVDGIDWDAGRVEACCRALLDGGETATAPERAAALEVLCGRIARSRVEHADGVAHVAISAGTLVEHGAPARPLGEVLLARIPDVLASARRYADMCLADTVDSPASAEHEDGERDDAVTEVDGHSIARQKFRSHLGDDRAGGAALAYLRSWVLPTVAALTRDRDLLLRAIADKRLCELAGALRESDAHWLDVLLGAQVGVEWLVVCPPQRRGFRVVLDGIVSNFDLHALLADALVPCGVDGERNPPDVIARVRGEISVSSRDYVVGAWNLYTARAAGFDLSDPRAAPTGTWVWGEGLPRDVPIVDGIRTVLVGPPAYSRTWNIGRTFSALPARVDVARELSAAELDEVLARLARRAAPS